MRRIGDNTWEFGLFARNFNNYQDHCEYFCQSIRHIRMYFDIFLISGV